MTYKITVDTGGTFTDAIVSEPNGSMTIGKALTTQSRVFDGVKASLESASQALNISLDSLLSRCNTLIYGTTRATNAIVTKNTAKTAFVTTQGFRDILFLKEGGKFNPHDFSNDYPPPFVPRRQSFEIDERITSEGTVSRPIDLEQARQVILEIKARKFEAIAVCLVWSIANPEHELALEALLKELLPGVPYTLSHQLIPIVREYRRASATAIDASLKPLMQAHLAGLQSDLQAAGFAGDLLISTSEGGCNQVEAMIAKPIYTIGSGPANAPVAAANYSELEDMGGDVIVCDTGGTTFDVGLVRGGELTYSRDTWLGPEHTGDLMAISAVDMRSIGAGGGSIAWIDDGGLMRVGPQSAGSAPGPACYGLGGELPTVSDAAAVLGYFDPDFFLGGKMKLDIAAARTAIATVADPLGLPVEAVAYQILRLAGDFMMQAISDITINAGFNPRESTIVAGGGAAGLNIMMIAADLGCSQVILPKVASALSAAGMQYANVVSEETASLVTSSARFDYDGVNTLLEDLGSRLDDFAEKFGISKDDYKLAIFAEARYPGQIWELDTPVPLSRFDNPADLDSLVQAFHEVHERVFAVTDEDSPVEIVNWKARLMFDIGKPTQKKLTSEAAIEPQKVARRDCYFGDEEPISTPIYHGLQLKPGQRIEGPAIVEEPTTNLVVYPGMSARVSSYSNYILDTGRGA